MKGFNEQLIVRTLAWFPFKWGQMKLASNLFFTLEKKKSVL